MLTNLTFCKVKKFMSGMQDMKAFLHIYIDINA